MFCEVFFFATNLLSVSLTEGRDPHNFSHLLFDLFRGAFSWMKPSSVLACQVRVRRELRCSPLPVTDKFAQVSEIYFDFIRILPFFVEFTERS